MINQKEHEVPDTKKVRGKLWTEKMDAICLMYHDISEMADASGFTGADAALYKISHSEFADHLRAIATAVKVKARRVTDSQAGETRFYMTFDDGGASALAAADMLDEYGWSGHFFITTGKIGTSAFVSRKEIIELHKRGHVVGSHSDSHPLQMARMSHQNILMEWKISCDRLAEILGEKVRVASVPGGLYSKEVAECAESIGIEFLFNSEPTTGVKKVGECQVLGRYAIQNWMKAREVSSIASGRIAPRLKQTLIWNAKKPLKMIGGEGFLRLRRFLINRR